MTNLSPEQIEARRALGALSRDEQRTLMHELELDTGAFVFFLPPFGRVTLGNGAILGQADPQIRMMLFVILGLLIVLVVYIVTLFIGKPFDEHLFTLMTAIVGYLAGVITPKPTTEKTKPV